MKDQIEQFRKLIQQHHRFVLTTHINPDADGIGSEMALASFLKSTSKHVEVINDSPTPQNCRFLDPSDYICHFQPENHSEHLKSAEVIVVLDTSQLKRLGRMEQTIREAKAKKVCIDHHLENERFADLLLVDESSPATGEIMYRLLEGLGSPFTPEIATSLYAAIMTDTGSFRFPKTTARLHRVIAQLIESGADPVRTYEQLYEQGTPERLQLLGRALAGLKTINDSKIAYIVITREMFKQTRTSEVDTDTFINYTLMIDGVEVGLMVSELEDALKVSFRSKGAIRINELAKEFGGNGHMNAAGARVSGESVESLLPKLLERAQTYINN